MAPLGHYKPVPFSKTQKRPACLVLTASSDRCLSASCLSCGAGIRQQQSSLKCLVQQGCESEQLGVRFFTDETLFIR